MNLQEIIKNPPKPTTTPAVQNFEAQLRAENKPYAKIITWSYEFASASQSLQSRHIDSPAITLEVRFFKLSGQSALNQFQEYCNTLRNNTNENKRHQLFFSQLEESHFKEIETLNLKDYESISLEINALSQDELNNFLKKTRNLTDCKIGTLRCSDDNNSTTLHPQSLETLSIEKTNKAVDIAIDNNDKLKHLDIKELTNSQLNIKFSNTLKNISLGNIKLMSKISICNSTSVEHIKNNQLSDDSKLFISGLANLKSIFIDPSNYNPFSDSPNLVLHRLHYPASTSEGVFEILENSERPRTKEEEEDIKKKRKAARENAECKFPESDKEE